MLLELTLKKWLINCHCYVSIWGSVFITKNRCRFEIFLRPVIDIYEQLSEYRRKTMRHCNIWFLASVRKWSKIVWIALTLIRSKYSDTRTLVHWSHARVLFMFWIQALKAGTSNACVISTNWRHWSMTGVGCYLWSNFDPARLRASTSSVVGASVELGWLWVRFSPGVQNFVWVFWC